MAQERVEVAIVGSNQTDQAFRDVESNLGRLEGKFTNLNAVVAGFAGGIGLAVAENIGGMLVDTFKFVTKAAEDAAISQRKLEAVLRATGNATGYTATQLNNLADKLARTTSFDDEAFREATATIVRFGNITGENLENVLRLSADYAALTGGSVTSAAQMFGRALNDPADGLKKLERNFGEFRPEVRSAVDELERLGDRSGAVALIVAELRGKIGGADASINTGLTGGVKELKKALAELAETIGTLASGNGNGFRFLAEQLQGFNAALNGTPLETLSAIGLLLNGPPGSAAAAFQAIARARGNTNLSTFGSMNTSLDGGDPAVTYGMGFYGPSNTEIELERKRREEQAKLGKEWAREQERLRQLDIRGWVAYIEALEAADIQRLRNEARISGQYWAEQDQIREEQKKAWIAYWVAVAEEKIRIDDETAKVIAERTQKEIAEREQYWSGFLSGIESGFRDVFDQIFRGQINSWRDFVSSLRDIFKRILLDFIYQSLARPFVLNIVASLAGSAGMSGLANAAGSAASSAGTSLLGSAITGSTGIGLATGAEFFAGMTGSFMGPAAAGSAAANGAAFAAFMTNPATLAVLAAVAIAVALQARRGGPKDGGSAFGTFDETGRFVPGFAPGTQNGRFYTPSGADSSMVAMTEGIGTAFAETLARLGGGSAAGFGFGFGFDRDPRGTAQTRVSGVVTDASGRVIFEAINREAGRSDEDLQDALGLIGRQSILAALQQSELPDAILAILRTVDAASASADEIDAVLRLAEAFSALQASFEDISVQDVLERASRSTVDVFQAQGQALLELANRSSLTTESLAALAQATGSYRASAEALILGLEQVRLQIDAMFGATRRNIEMAGLDDQGRYDFLQDEAARLFELLGSASSGEEIARLAEQINRSINEAFGLLSPEDQAAMRDEFLTRLDTVNAATQERLRQLQQEAAEEANRQLAEVRRIMEEMALAQQAAANTQQDAANTQLRAANTTRTFNINVDLQNGNTVVTDGG